VLGANREWATPLLRPTDELAPCYPKQNANQMSQYSYRVICHNEDNDDFVGICPDDHTDRIRLTREDLIVWELDPIELARRLAECLALSPDAGPVERLPFTYKLGVYEPFAAEETWCYFTLATAPSDVENITAALAVRHSDQILLFSLTQAGWATYLPAVRSRLKRALLPDVFLADSSHAADAFAAAISLSRLLQPAGVSVPSATPTPVATGFLRIEDIREQHRDLTEREIDCLQKKMQRWRKTHEDDVIVSDEDPDTGRRRYAYPSQLVQTWLTSVLAERSKGESTRVPRTSPASPKRPPK
jgi:hypothetical protein